VSLSENLSSAADYTRRFFEKAGDLLLLFILTLIPIVDILTLGYLGRVMSDSSDSRHPPKMEKYSDMFVDGLKYLAAAIIWAIPMVVVTVIVGFLLFMPVAITATSSIGGNFTNPTYWQNFNWTNWGDALSNNPAVASAFVLAIIPFAIIIFMLAVFIGLFSIIGIVHMFKTRSFTKAFALGDILSIISKIGWLRYLGFIIVAAILGFIVSIFSAIPVIGWLITAFLGLLLSIFIARTISLMYDTAMAGTTFGKPQPPVPPTLPIVSQPSSSVQETAYCTSCGAPNPKDAIYCNKCGKALGK
jgi:hypothetical protein